LTTTRAPAAASPSETPLPIPVPPPVTTATLPSSKPMLASWITQVYGPPHDRAGGGELQ
jgi:hypothetical protein